MAKIGLDLLIDRLLFRLKSGKEIIPVIGYDLFMVNDNDKNIPFLEFISNKIASEADIDLTKNSYTDNFNFVLDKIKKTKNLHEVIIKKVNEIGMERINQDTIVKLAGISSFKYFINTTFTNYLESALREVRGGEVLNASFPFHHKNPKVPQDVKITNRKLRPSIYDLFGTIREKYAFAITDDDILRLVIDFNKNSDFLKNLRSVLDDSALLFIGCKYSDWLFRFFLTSLRPRIIDEEDDQREPSHIILDEATHKESIFFITKHGIDVFECPSAIDFVNKLFSISEIQKIKHFSGPSFMRGLGRELFISYASEDSDLALRIHDQLLESEIPVWLDQKKIDLGNSIDEKVKKGLDETKSILVLVTNASIDKGTNQGSYLAKEWEYIKLNHANKVIPVYANHIPLNNDLHFNLRQVLGVENNILKGSLTTQGEMEETIIGKLKSLI